jgi:hypothetical protein
MARQPGWAPADGSSPRFWNADKNLVDEHGDINIKPDEGWKTDYTDLLLRIVLAGDFDKSPME